MFIRQQLYLRDGSILLANLSRHPLMLMPSCLGSLNYGDAHTYTCKIVCIEAIRKYVPNIRKITLAQTAVLGVAQFTLVLRTQYTVKPLFEWHADLFFKPSPVVTFN